MNILYEGEPVRLIKLSSGKIAIVDACDYEYLSKWKWSFYSSSTSKCGGYAARVDLSTGKRVKLSMHRLVFAQRSGLDISSLKDIDHKNRLGLDNRFSNLRHATRHQNSGNRGPNSNNTSGYKGVKPDQKRPGVWVAQIQDNGKKVNLGYFNSPEEAALAYNEAAVRVFGEFAYLNQVASVSKLDKRVSRNSTSYQFKGVSFHKHSQRWVAYGKRLNGKRQHIGSFKTEKEAQKAYEKFVAQSYPSEI